MAKVISSLQNPLVKHLVRLRTQRHYREEHQSALLEGRKIISEIGQHHPIKQLITCDARLIPSNLTGQQIVIASEEVVQKISGTQHPEGIVAEVPLPAWSSLQKSTWIVVCDGISDPGNLGTLIRTALALGWEGMFLLENCCDPFNDKAIRAAKGASFKLPLARGDVNVLKLLAEKNHLTPLIADLHGTSIDQVQIHKGVLLILGHEAYGISAEIKTWGQSITIPMRGKMESLNVAVAGGILMYELRI